MPPPKISTSFTVTLFAIAGLVLGFCSLGLIDIVFYTTKAVAFLEDWHFFLFIALFAISFSLIPLAAARSPSRRLIWFLVIWVGATSLTGLVVSLATAIVHRQTLSIPDGLVPVGLLAIPIVSGVTFLLMPRFWRARHETCA